MDERSCGVNLPTSRGPEKGRIKRIVGLAKTAERLGFDSVWVPDYLVESRAHVETGENTGGILEPLVILGYLSAVTSRVRLGTGVLLLPLRHPLVVAKMVGTLDFLSKGRCILGVGVGRHKAEFDSVGASFENRGSITDESISLMRSLWDKGPVKFHGKHFTLNDVSIAPKPVSEKNLPVWIGGNSPSAIKRAAKLGDAWYPTDPTAGEIRRGIKALRDEYTKNRRTPQEVLVACNIFMCVDKTTRKAKRRVEFLVEWTHEPFENVLKWSIAGDPKTVRKRLNEYIAAGVQYFVFSFPPDGKEEYTCKLLSQEVLK